MWPRPQGVLTKKCKIRSKVLLKLKVSHDLFYELVIPLHISGIFEARNFKFSRLMLVTRGTNKKMQNEIKGVGKSS